MEGWLVLPEQLALTSRGRKAERRRRQMVASTKARGRNLRGRAHWPPREPHSAHQTTKEPLPVPRLEGEGTQCQAGFEQVSEGL